MGKIIIDTPDASYYYCGSCAEKVSYNATQCPNCKDELNNEKAFQVSNAFDPGQSIVDQLNIFESAQVDEDDKTVQTTKKLQVNSEGASFFYCKNCNETVSRKVLQCPNCNSYFSGIINVDSAPSNITSQSESNPFEDLDTFEPAKQHSVGQIYTSDPQQEKSNSEGKFVGFWKRALAYIIDFMAIILFSYIVGAFLGGFFLQFDIYIADASDGFFNLFGFLLTWLYYALWESSIKQATLGKMAIGAKVVDYNGDRIGFAQATGRHLSKFISGIALGLGFIAVAFSKNKQGWHDQIASTVVVNKNYLE